VNPVEVLSQCLPGPLAVEARRVIAKAHKEKPVADHLVWAITDVARRVVVLTAAGGQVVEPDPLPAPTARLDDHDRLLVAAFTARLEGLMAGGLHQRGASKLVVALPEGWPT
jgi:hypothetical protein